MSDELPKTGRRAFLAFGVSAALAGCVRGSGGTGKSDDSTTMRDRPATSDSTASTSMPDESPTASTIAPTISGTDSHETTSGFVRINSSRSQPQTTVNVTDATLSTDGSATISVWNDAETARQIRVAITERNSGESVFRETYRLEADAYVELELTKPGKYTLDVGLDGNEPTTIDFLVDTCNSLGINVAIRGGGTVESTQTSTVVGCPIFTTTDSTN